MGDVEERTEAREGRKRRKRSFEAKGSEVLLVA